MIGGVCRCVSSVTRHICKVIHQGAARGGPFMLSTLDIQSCYVPLWRHLGMSVLKNALLWLCWLINGKKGNELSVWCIVSRLFAGGSVASIHLCVRWQAVLFCWPETVHRPHVSRRAATGDEQFSLVDDSGSSTQPGHPSGCTLESSQACNTVHLEIPVSETWHEGNDVSSVRSPVVDKGKIRTGHWLGLVLWVCFSALMVLFWWQERNLQRISSQKYGGKKLWRGSECRFECEMTIKTCYAVSTKRH